MPGLRLSPCGRAHRPAAGPCLPRSSSFDGGGTRVSIGDRGLVARASRGDVEAFRQLVLEHSGLVYRLASRMLGREEAQDASQEVWVRVWRYIGTFREDSAFTTWLHRITVNTCLSFRQREARRGEREYSGDEMPYLSEPSGGDGDPEAAALGPGGWEVL